MDCLELRTGGLGTTLPISRGARRLGGIEPLKRLEFEKRAFKRETVKE